VKHRGRRRVHFLMTTTQPKPSSAWEPLTPRGVAAFGRAPLKRLLLVQLIVAFAAAGSVVWFLERGWFPVVRAAIQALPEQGEIRGEQLAWPGESPVQLASNPFLGVAVDLNHSGQLRSDSHLQIEFGRRDFRVSSILGYKPLDYPAGQTIDFNRKKLEPWWGAWEPILAVATAAATVLGLMVAWFALATLYCAPIRLITFLTNRDLNWVQSWRLAGAVLMPGALFFTAAILCYTLHWIDLVSLGGAGVLHIAVGWIYLVLCPWFLPHVTAEGKVSGNPFAAAPPSGTSPSTDAK
jgi:hypothetical protein